MPSVSFERLVSSSTSLSPLQHREHSSSYRDIRSSARDFYLSVRDVRLPTVYDSPVPLQLSYRSKSYHGDLNRTNLSVFSGLSKCSSDLFRSNRSLSHYSPTTYNNNCRNTYSSHSLLSVNAYSKHYSHHNHWSHTPILPLNSRCRFQKRHAYKAYRSRSANPLLNEEYVSSSGIGCRSALLGTSSIQRITTTQDSHIRTKSMSDIRSSPATLRPHCSISSILPRYSSVRTILDKSAYSKSILNPDVYVRWLRSRRVIEDVVHRRDYTATNRFSDSIGAAERRWRETSYLSRSRNYISCYGKPHHISPTFEHPIKGNLRCVTCNLALSPLTHIDYTMAIAQAHSFRK